MAGQMTRQKASSAMSRMQELMDRVVPPEPRRELIQNTQNFAIEHPIVATFLATQILLSALPLLLFVSFSLVTLVMVIVAAAGISVFWIGAALLVLVPTLFATVSAGVLIWLWAVGTYLFCRSAYQMTYGRTQQKGASLSSSMKSNMKAVTDGLNPSSTTPNDRFIKKKNAVEDALPSSVPDIVKRSINQARESAEAAANPEAVQEKKEVEDEIRQEFGEQDESRQNGYYSNGTSSNPSRHHHQQQQQLQQQQQPQEQQQQLDGYLEREERGDFSRANASQPKRQDPDGFDQRDDSSSYHDFSQRERVMPEGGKF